MEEAVRMLIGTYGPKDQDTIFELRIPEDPENATITPFWRGTRNPSYLAFSPDHRVLYAVEEGTSGKIHSILLKKDPVILTSQETCGADPCHILVDPQKRLVFVSNYTSGSLAAFPMREDEALLPLNFLDQHTGHGVNPKRQEGPHVHCAFFDQQGNILSCDLGLDRIFAYQTREDRTILRDSGLDVTLPAGSGPRHLYVPHRFTDLIYAVSELSGEVFVIRSGKILQECSVRDNSRDGNTTAAVKADSRENHLYVSNRGDDTIAHFSIGPDGLLSLREIVPCGEKAPRDILVTDRYLVAANQDSSTITILLRSIDGALSDPVCTLSCPHPSCLLPC